jgi:hypothetical protein
MKMHIVRLIDSTAMAPWTVVSFALHVVEECSASITRGREVGKRCCRLVQVFESSAKTVVLEGAENVRLKGKSACCLRVVAI